MQQDGQARGGHAVPCVSFCETVDPSIGVGGLESLLAQTCWDAGFPYCERVYAGSYFCENYFLSLTDGFHEALCELCVRYEMGATLVVPIFGQAFLAKADQRIGELLDRFGDLYDEVVVNDVACFADLAARCEKRIGLGRLFSKGLRDPRYPEVFGTAAYPELSAEARACVQAWQGFSPLVEVDPSSSVVDVAQIVKASPTAEVAIHLPYCYATTGRNCSSASIDLPDSEKFRLGRGCNLECLRMVQGSRVDEGMRYVKHGRTYYFANPACEIAGVEGWRVVYAASSESEGR